MKKIIYMLACISAICSYSCSYDDLSTSLDKLIPDIIIDTIGIPEILIATYGNQLVVEPKVSCQSNPERDFSYEWRMTKYATPITTTPASLTPYDIISTEEKLDIIVENLPDAGHYYLWYRVTDNKTKQVRGIVWRVLVDASSGQGLLIAHSSDGLTSDLSVIQDTLFTVAFTRSNSQTGPYDPTKIKQNVYSAANGTKYNGIIKELMYLQRYYDSRIQNLVEGHTGNHIFRINLLDFTLQNEDLDLFLDDAIPIIDVKRIIMGSSFATERNGYPSTSTQSIIWNNRGFQAMRCPSQSTSPYVKYGYGRASAGSWAAGSSSVGIDITYDPDPIIAQGSGNTTTVPFMFYDRLNGQFQYLSTSLSESSKATDCTYSDTHPFDPRNIGPLEIIQAGAGDNADFRFVVKQNGEYKILTMLQSNGSARAIININNAPNIDKAIHFAVCVNQPVVYYATSDNELYSILFIDGLGNNVSYNLVYTSSDPINGLYFTRQKSIAKTIEYNGIDKDALIMTTTLSQSEGKVWVLPIGNIGTGMINASEIVSFSGFGRISAITMID